MLLFTAALVLSFLFKMCGWVAEKLSFHQWHFTLVAWHPGWKDQCCRSFLHWTFALHSSRLVQKAACWCALLSSLFHYTPTCSSRLCVTWFSILICSATWYSFSAFLHLIRTGCVPPNNGIMTGTGWFLVLVLSASWLRARALQWESLLPQMWHNYECQGLLLLIGYPHHLVDSAGALD